jgi:hypothetical protein
MTGPRTFVIVANSSIHQFNCENSGLIRRGGPLAPDVQHSPGCVA